MSALRLTPEQAAAVERLYQASLPARRQASEERFGLTGRIAKRIEAGDDDDEPLHLTEKLAKAQSAQCDLRRQMLRLWVELGLVTPGDLSR